MLRKAVSSLQVSVGLRWQTYTSLPISELGLLISSKLPPCSTSFPLPLTEPCLNSGFSFAEFRLDSRPGVAMRLADFDPDAEE